jgi:DNA-binding transcriptional LysR family regulator
MDLAAALRAFVRIVERGSMTAAAADLGVTQPAVSKLLRNLEAHAGARLIERNPRAMRPTPEGRALYEAAGGALATLDAALESLRGTSGALSGRLRLHGPACVGERHLARILMDFQDAHPGVEADLVLENRAADLIHENYDLALRMGRPAESGLVLRRIGFSRRILVAAPAYLSRRGAPAGPHDLCAHDLIVTDASLRAGALFLRQGEARIEIAARPRLSTNNAQVLLEAALSGRGVATAQMLLAAEHLQRGHLVRVLPDCEIEPTELFLVYPCAKFLRPLVRAFIDFAAPRLRAIEGVF